MNQAEHSAIKALLDGQLSGKLSSHPYIVSALDETYEAYCLNDDVNLWVKHFKLHGYCSMPGEQTINKATARNA